jgi:hypothetical protein
MAVEVFDRFLLHGSGFQQVINVVTSYHNSTDTRGIRKLI